MGVGAGSGSLWVPAVANFHVQYNFQSIAIALVVMKERYPRHDWEVSVLTSVVFAGAITGQLLFGYIGDLIGRNRAMVLTNLITVCGALGSGVFGWGPSEDVYIAIAVCRFFLGVGVGGVYPLSATKAAEDAGSSDPAARSQRVSWVFFWQTPGSMFPFVAALVCHLALPHHTSAQFRLILGLGAVPAFLCFAKSLTEKESSEFTQAHQGDRTSAAVHSRGLWWKLVGTGGSWMLYDICYYGTALFAPKIIENIFGDDEDVIAVSWQTIVSNAMGIPAVLATIYCLRFATTKQVQVAGFLLIAVSYVLMAVLLSVAKHQHALVFAFYCLVVFALNFGPNVTTFALPQETFPAEARSTFNGLAAAMAKVGALIGAYVYSPLDSLLGLSATMVVCAGISVVGAVLTWVCVDDVELPNANKRLSDRLLRDDQIQ